MQLFAMVELSIKLLKTGCFKVKRRSETGAKKRIASIVSHFCWTICCDPKSTSNFAASDPIRRGISFYRCADTDFCQQLWVCNRRLRGSWG
jgi:hypothetical protein